MLYIPPEAEHILSVLRKNGYEACLVGGCVRDMLMDIPPHDYDITTSAPPEITLSLFEKTVPTGIKHGTVTVIENGTPFEVTTYRSDGKYSDCRRPESVTFVKSLREDLARRDFTSNAIAYGGGSDIKDYFGGTEDIKKGILRAVGDPSLRFKEDALRILRLFRFASVLGFTPEEKTLKAALADSPLLRKISAERILAELEKALEGKNPSALKPLTDIGGLDFIGLKKSPDYKKIAALKGTGLSLFGFLYLSGADVTAALDYLKVPNSTKRLASRLLALLSMPFPAEKADIKEMLFLTDSDAFQKYLIFERFCLDAGTGKAEELFGEIIKNGEPYRICDLKIKGGDLKKLGTEGEKTGEVLEYLRRTAVKDPSLNKKSLLFEKAAEFIRN